VQVIAPMAAARAAATLVIGMFYTVLRANFLPFAN
jgi:hypothetical protein